MRKMASSLLSELMRILLCAFVLSVHGSFEKQVHVHGAQITVPLSSLSPSVNCTASTTNGNSSLKLVHKYGACSQLFDGRPINHTQVLLEDMARVKWIQSKVSNSVSGTSDSKESTVNLPASYGPSGYSYVVTIGLGTPTKDLTLLFDTGSALTWTQCEPCIVSCYSQAQPIFDPSQSSSYASISCNASSCTQLSSTTGGQPNCSGSTCFYGATYGDKSFSDGLFATETLTLTPTDVITNFKFGCGENNQGTFNRFAGLLGLARDPISIVEQSATQYGQYFGKSTPQVVCLRMGRLDIHFVSSPKLELKKLWGQLKLDGQQYILKRIGFMLPTLDINVQSEVMQALAHFWCPETTIFVLGDPPHPYNTRSVTKRRMANQAEIAAMIDEKLKEQVNTMNEQIAATTSKLMSDLMTKQQQINAASQSEIPPPTCQGLRLDKTPAVNTDPTFQLDDVILTDTSVSPAAHVLHPPPNDENAKLLAKLD
ncbi:aspartyl protease family protein At5g10770-like [Syzygium oleosum]|uniref:aspartyl protease family protein At5g10770-like n=1 Tax=Syzygium oleosum TaxID=219896 RepID=UPI0024BB11B9|nr:aspartyl protease family protein At5g10770-like [Syzygium oleosum]